MTKIVVENRYFYRQVTKNKRVGFSLETATLLFCGLTTSDILSIAQILRARADLLDQLSLMKKSDLSTILLFTDENILKLAVERYGAVIEDSKSEKLTTVCEQILSFHGIFSNLPNRKSCRRDMRELAEVLIEIENFLREQLYFTQTDTVHEFRVFLIEEEMQRLQAQHSNKHKAA